MGISRRRLLGGCTLWAAVAAMPTALRVAALAQPKSGLPLTKELWTALQGSAFDVTSGTNHQTLTLVAVEDAPAPPQSGAGSTPQLTAFTLRFYGGVKQLKQGTYSFKGDKTGGFSLFIVPGNDPLFYDAVINRL